jgi:hypothetical protein
VVGDVAAQAAHLYGIRERLADDDVSVAYCTRRQPALPVAAAVIEQVDRQLSFDCRSGTCGSARLGTMLYGERKRPTFE